jgi:amidase
MKHLISYLLLLLFSISSCLSTIPKKAKNYNDFRFLEMEIPQLQQGYQSGKYTIKEVVKAYLNRIKEIDQNGPKLNSVICINPDALQIAEELDKELKEGKKRGPLHGIPVIIKDNIDTHDKMPTTAGSRALKNSYPLQDSYVTKKLREAGAVIIGKANLSEWANFRGHMSTSGWSGLGGQTNNPYDVTRNPNGSSSGSGVAVSANLCMLAIGTETDGSIVGPSSANGIVGIKPTVGLISRSGIIPISFTQDTPGPMTRTVRDAAICLGALTGVDSLDNKTLESKSKSLKDYTQFLKEDGLKGKRIGFYKPAVVSNYKVTALMLKAVEFMKSKGAEIIELDKISEDNLER